MKRKPPRFAGKGCHQKEIEGLIDSINMAIFGIWSTVRPMLFWLWRTSPKPPGRTKKEYETKNENTFYPTQISQQAWRKPHRAC
jgi:hypothetical protein